MIDHKEAQEQARGILKVPKAYNWIEQLLAAAYLDLRNQACAHCKNLGRACPACIASRIKLPKAPQP